MVVMTKKAAKQQPRCDDDDWILVDDTKARTVEKGWVVVPDKKKTDPDEILGIPERIDKVLACYGFCKRSEAKAWVRNERVCFEGIPVTSVGQKVIVRRHNGVTVDGKAIGFRSVAGKENDEFTATAPGLQLTVEC